MGILLCFLCSVCSLFTLLSAKPANAQVGTAHQPDRLSSHPGRCWFPDCLMCQKHCDGFCKNLKNLCSLSKSQDFLRLLRERKIKKRFEAIQFSRNKSLPRINLSLFYHRLSLLQKSRVIALNQERVCKDMIHFKYKLFPIVCTGQCKPNTNLIQIFNVSYQF